MCMCVCFSLSVWIICNFAQSIDDNDDDGGGGGSGGGVVIELDKLHDGTTADAMDNTHEINAPA